MRTLVRAIRERLTGGKPGAFRALVAAVAAAVLTYRLLRSGN